MRAARPKAGCCATISSRPRGKKLGRSMGLCAVSVEEIAGLRKSRDVEKAFKSPDEAERLADRVQDGAHVVLLDAAARQGHDILEDFAEMLGALRDAGTVIWPLSIGGPIGLSPRCRAVTPGRSLAFGPQTWPHLLARALHWPSRSIAPSPFWPGESVPSRARLGLTDSPPVIAALAPQCPCTVACCGMMLVRVACKCSVINHAHGN